MVAPQPVDPRRWDVVYLDGDGRSRFGSFDWGRSGELSLSPVRLTAAPRAWLAERGGERIPGFLRWARFPWIEAGTPAGRGHAASMAASIPTDFSGNPVRREDKRR